MSLAHVPYAEVAVRSNEQGFDSVRFAVGPAMRAIPADDHALQGEFSFTALDEHAVLRRVAYHVREATGIEASVPDFRRDGSARAALREWVGDLRFADAADECGIQVVDVTSAGSSGMVLVMSADVDLEGCLRQAGVDADVVRHDPEPTDSPRP